MSGLIVRNDVKFSDANKKWRLAYERFNSVSEAVREVESRMRSPFEADPATEAISSTTYARELKGLPSNELGAGHKLERETFERWDGGEKNMKNWGDLKRAVEGDYRKNLEEFKQAIKVHTGKMPKRKTVLSVEGHTPCVPNAILGFPLDMYTTRQMRVGQKTVNIAIDSGAHCGISSSQLTEANSKIAAAIIKLEQEEGIRCGIYAYAGAVYSEYSCLNLFAARLKRPQDPIDIKRLLFPLTSTAFFRVIGFNWWSSTPKCMVQEGYGRPINVELSNEAADEIAQIVTNDSATVRISTAEVLRMSAEQIMKYIKEHAKTSLERANSRKRRR